MMSTVRHHSRYTQKQVKNRFDTARARFIQEADSTDTNFAFTRQSDRARARIDHPLTKETLLADPAQQKMQGYLCLSQSSSAIIFLAQIAIKRSLALGSLPLQIGSCSLMAILMALSYFYASPKAKSLADKESIEWYMSMNQRASNAKRAYINQRQIHANTLLADELTKGEKEIIENITQNGIWRNESFIQMASLTMLSDLGSDLDISLALSLAYLGCQFYLWGSKQKRVQLESNKKHADYALSITGILIQDRRMIQITNNQGRQIRTTPYNLRRQNCQETRNVITDHYLSAENNLTAITCMPFVIVLGTKAVLDFRMFLAQFWRYWSLPAKGFSVLNYSNAKLGEEQMSPEIDALLENIGPNQLSPYNRARIESTLQEISIQTYNGQQINKQDVLCNPHEVWQLGRYKLTTVDEPGNIPMLKSLVSPTCSTSIVYEKLELKQIKQIIKSIKKNRSFQYFMFTQSDTSQTPAFSACLNELAEVVTVIEIAHI